MSKDVIGGNIGSSPIIIHKCVENIEEIPKLKLFTGKDKKRTRAPCEFLQEFQYGNDMFQTTTNNRL